MKNYIKYLGILTLGIVSCEPEFENPVDEQTRTVSSGEADFSNYVALGNSLTAGYADNALYISGQENSFPNILAQQFAMAEGGEFTQPLMSDDAGGLLLNGNPLPDFGNRLVLAFGSDGPSPMVYTGMEPTTEVGETLTGSFNNMGVPGAKSFHLTAESYGDIAGVPAGLANPYFARFASSPGTSILADALAQNPTFFSLWIGNNDVLSYAISGGTGEDQSGTGVPPSEYGSNDITDPNVFAQVYAGLVTALTANDADGVLINIPNVTDVPYFTTVPVNAIPLDEETAAMLNGQFVAYNEQILPGLVQAGALSAEEMAQRQINFSAGQNYVTLIDEDLTDISQMIQAPPFGVDAQTAGMLGQLRQATDEDLLTLPTSSILGTTVNDNPALINGVSVPLGDGNVLTPEEQANIAAATEAYNNTIEQMAASSGLAFLDANALLAQLASEGITATDSQGNPTARLTSTFVTGGAFSLDGVHLTPRGYALVANKIIEEINETYGSTLRKVNVGNYRTFTPSNEVN